MFALVSDRVVTPAGERRAAVWIDGEKIHDVTDPEAVPGGMPREDLGARVLMPGLVDTHVHVNEPGRTEWEGFATATAAAAAGGVTSLVDMPLNCIPVTTTGPALETKREAMQGQLSVDVGCWGGVVPGDPQHLTDMSRNGMLGAKAFLCHSGIDDFPASDEETLRSAMKTLAKCGVPLLAHAELELDEPACDAPATSYRAWLERRPARWEDEAIALLIRLCRETGCRTHVVHLSSASALPMIAEAKEEGLPLSVETCPHYLCLSAEQVADHATEFKCAPPIRDDANRERLWAGLLDGVIDFVVTDHSPCVPQLKSGGFVDAWGGISSLSLGLSSVWTEARARGATVNDLVRWMCEAPAAFAGLGHKGRLEAGRDADLVCWDPDEKDVVRADDLRFRHHVSPYVGRTLAGRVHGTWLRGARIYDGASVTARRGSML